jgi:hypothetical protein
MVMRLPATVPVIALLAAGCGAATTGAGRGEGADRPAIALQRGGSWSTLSVAPPRIIGPSVELQLKNGDLRGFAGGGAMDVHIGNAEASGYGPSGPVELDMENRNGQLVVAGMWNGGPVHLTLAPGALHGSVIRRGSGRVASEQSCGYELDRQEGSGALVGRSTCGGMPQETRLEIDPRVAGLLTPTEMTVVLVAALASPPATREWY